MFLKNFLQLTLLLKTPVDSTLSTSGSFPYVESAKTRYVLRGM